MPASDYKHKPGGGLKLKGGPADPTKKKKKKSSSSKKLRGGDDEESRELTQKGGAGQGGEDDDDPDQGETAVTVGSSTGGLGKTKAQLKFEEVQKRRLLDKSSKSALKSHKERVAEFNEQLEAMPQHYDIPKLKS
ncbi:hypothetical protein JCM11491_003781 [Sporobolomyces phaffii]